MFSNLRILFLIIPLLLSSCITTQPSQPKVVYKTKVVYKCDLPKLPNPPQPPQVNLYKVNLNNKVYYCYDSDSAYQVSQYLILLQNYLQSCRLITQQGVSNGNSRTNGQGN